MAATPGFHQPPELASSHVSAKARLHTPFHITRCECGRRWAELGRKSTNAGLRGPAQASPRSSRTFCPRARQGSRVCQGWTPAGISPAQPGHTAPLVLPPAPRPLVGGTYPWLMLNMSFCLPRSTLSFPHHCPLWIPVSVNSARICPAIQTAVSIIFCKFCDSSLPQVLQQAHQSCPLCGCYASSAFQSTVPPDWSLQGYRKRSTEMALTGFQTKHLSWLTRLSELCPQILAVPLSTSAGSHWSLSPSKLSILVVHWLEHLSSIPIWKNIRLSSRLIEG